MNSKRIWAFRKIKGKSSRGETRKWRWGIIIDLRKIDGGKRPKVALHFEREKETVPRISSTK
jgi:hypothetical protein